MVFTVTNDFSSGVNVNFSTELNENFEDIEGALTTLQDATTNSINPWQYIETMTFSGVSTLTSSTLPVYDEYLVEIEELSGTTTGTINLRINGISTNSYQNHYSSSGTLVFTTNQSAVLGNIQSTSKAQGFVRFNGLSPAVTSGRISFVIGVNGDSTIGSLGSSLTIGNAVQVSTITILQAGTMTGTVQIYGRNYR